MTNFAKKDLTPNALSPQSKLNEANNEANNKVLEEVPNSSDTITKLSSELSVTKNDNTIFSSRPFTLEQQCRANVQYSRRECLTVVAIPRKISEKEVEEKVLDVFDKMG